MAHAEDVESDVEGVENSVKEKEAEEEVPNGKETKDEKEGSEEEDEEEEEYEIEEIIQCKRGYFKPNELAYLVSWKGYGPEHNSWVNETDAEGAKELIDEFHKSKAKTKAQSSISKGPRKSLSTKSTKPGNGSEDGSVVKRGRGHSSKAGVDKENGSLSTLMKRKRKRDQQEDEDIEMDEPEDSTGMEDSKEFMPMKKSKHSKVKDWEALVAKIDTVETQKNQLYCYFTTFDGEKIKDLTTTCAKRFPQKLIEFYESHLRWKAADQMNEDD